MKYMLPLVALIAFLPAIAETPSSKDISAALQPFVEAHTLAGAVALVADKDGVKSINAVGFADIEAKIPMKPDTMFWIASESKPITAVALMMLVDEGKVKLDDPLSKYLPEFQNLWVAAYGDDSHVLLKRPKMAPTIRQILSHTSGMPFASPFERPTLDGLPLREAVRTYAMTPLATEPGTKYAYSNAGINSAGRVIEVVSGMSYEEFLTKRLLEPLGMKDTTYFPSPEQAKRIAKSYKPTADKTGLESLKIGQLTYPLDGPNRYPMPAGGLFSTADDVAKFARMMLNNGTLDGKRYLSEAAVKELTTKQTGEALKDTYGLGFAVWGEGFGHGGAMATDLHIDTKRGLIFIWMVQHAVPPGNASGAFRKAAIEQFAKP